MVHITSAAAALMDCHKALDGAGVPGAHKTLEGRVLSLIAENERLTRLLEKQLKQTDRDRLLALLDEDRSEVLMMLADACVDEGRPKEAQGWGWLASGKKWPAWCRKGWLWYRSYDESIAHSAALPHRLWESCASVPAPYHGTDFKYFPTCSAALLAVVDVIRDGKWSVGT